MNIVNSFFLNLTHRTTILLINQASSLLIIFFMLTRLDVSHFGLISSALIIYNIIFIIMEWGFAIHSINTFNFLDKIELEKKISSAHWAKIIFFLISSVIIVFLFYQNIVLLENTKLLISLILLIFISVFNPLWLLQFLNKTEKLIIPTFFSRILQFLIIFVFLSNENSYIIILSQVFSFSIISICGYNYIIKEINILKKICFYEIISIVKASFGIFINNISQNFTHSFWGGYIVFFGTNIHISIFNLADTFFRAGNALSNIFPEVLLTNFKKKIDLKNIFFLVFIGLIIVIISILLIKFFLINFIKFASSEHLIFFYTTVGSWFVLTAVKIVGYPILSKIKSIAFVNKAGYVVFLLHLIFIIYFSLFIKEIDLKHISLVYLLISIIYLLIFLVNIFVKKKFKYK